MRKERIEWIHLGEKRVLYRWQKKKVKNFNLRVHRSGEVRISTPSGCTHAEAEAFLLRNKDFILRALERWERQASSLGDVFSLEDGGTVPLLGQLLTLRVSIATPYGVTLREGCLWVFAPSKEQEAIRRVLRDWMGRKMEEWMPSLCQTMAERMVKHGVSEPTLRYRCMVARWGSCCKAKKEITFNKFLLCAPVSCVEYVVCHEMVHLVEANHSPAFYRILSELMPDWRSRRDELSRYGSWIREL